MATKKNPDAAEVIDADGNPAPVNEDGIPILSAEDEPSVIPSDGTVEQARAILDAAKAAGLDESVVRTGQEGYLVPKAVADAHAKAAPKSDEK